MEKFIRDGKVAVLISPGYGAGWSTWCQEYGEAPIFDKDIVQAFLEGKEVEVVAKEKYPKAYLGGLCDLTVEWLDPGTRFIINEYDGSESLIILSPEYGFTA